MRILVVSPYGRRGGYSGPAVFMRRLFSELSRAHEVAILTAKDAAPPEGYPWAESTILLARNRELGGTRQLVWSMRASLWLLVRASRFDLVHFHGAYLFNLLPALALRLRHVPYAVLPVGPADLSSESRLARIPLLAAIRRRIVASASFGFAISSTIRTQFYALGLPQLRVHSLGNAVDLDWFRASGPGPTGPRAQGRTLLFVGKIGPLKRPTLILDALQRLRAQGFDAHARFLGPFESSAYEREFQERAAELGVTKYVTTHGHVPAVEPFLVMEDSSLFVLPSAQEGLPGALVEALAAGLPCAVTQIGSMADVVLAADAGRVIEPDASDIASFAIDAWTDPERWERWSGRGARYAREHYSSQAVAAQYLKAILDGPVEEH